MKSFNIKYTNLDNLEIFISIYNIKSYDNILLQIFTGICKEDFIITLINSIKNLIPHIQIIGTTTSGEILEGNSFKNSTVLSFSVFEKTKVKTYYTPYIEDSYKMGKKLIKQFNFTQKPKVAITFTDGLKTNGEEYIKSFNKYSKDLIVAGGLAGDNEEFKQTIVFTQDKILKSGAVVALLFNDNLIVHTQASFGWESIGKTMQITKSKKNVVYEIDNKKAIDIYAKYLGSDIANLMPKTGIEFPLIVKRDNLNIPRAVVGKNSDDSLIFAGNLKEGDKVTFGYGNVDAILEYSNNIAASSGFCCAESIFVYSCMARLALMQDSIKDEMKALAQITNVSGFFTYGEFYTNTKNKKNELLNQTMTILSLSENKNRKNTALKTPPKSTNRNNLTHKALFTLISQTSKEVEEINKSLKEQVAREIEENIKKEKLLLQQTRLAQMGEMISMIAHQWRQPLSAISSSVAILQIKMAKNRFNLDKKDEREEFLNFLEDKHNSISNYTESLSETIDDFRNLFKPTRKKSRVSLTKPIKKALSIVKSSMVNSGIKINTFYKVDTQIDMYKNELMQVILNILKNAEDNFREREIEDAKINIFTLKDKDSYIIKICDNGGGIDNKILPKIFDPYFSTKDDKNGTGLGLYIAKILVEDHNDGVLEVENTKDGVCFIIKLKRASLNS